MLRSSSSQLEETERWEDGKEAQFYVITGGPGAGKTAVIDCLRKRGYSCIDEFSRAFIREEVGRGGDRLPWKNIAAFNKVVLKGRIRQFRNAPEGICFFDRGIPDSIAYFHNAGMEVPPIFYLAGNRYRYQRYVFFLPPWRDIFVNDFERKESFEGAIEISNNLRRTYSELGYALIELPNASVNERVDVILSYVYD